MKEINELLENFSRAFNSQGETLVRFDVQTKSYDSVFHTGFDNKRIEVRVELVIKTFSGRYKIPILHYREEVPMIHFTSVRSDSNKTLIQRISNKLIDILAIKQYSKEEFMSTFSI